MIHAFFFCLSFAIVLTNRGNWYAICALLLLLYTFDIREFPLIALLINMQFDVVQWSWKIRMCYKNYSKSISWYVWYFGMQKRNVVEFLVLGIGLRVLAMFSLLMRYIIFFYQHCKNGVYYRILSTPILVCRTVKVRKLLKRSCLQYMV